MIYLFYENDNIYSCHWNNEMRIDVRILAFQSDYFITFSSLELNKGAEIMRAIKWHFRSEGSTVLHSI